MSEGTAEIRVFYSKYFEKERTDAQAQLGRIPQTYNDLRSSGSVLLARLEIGHISVVRKWFIHLLLLPILSARGQRSQVYAQLQDPSEKEISDMKGSVESNSFFELPTAMENTQRFIEMPNVVVPGFS